MDKFEYVANKLDLSKGELKQLFELPKKYYHDYKNKKWLISLGTKIMRYLGLERRYFR